MKYNEVLIQAVIFKPFLAKKSGDKKSIKIRIFNFPYTKTNLVLTYSKLLDIMTPYGFDRELIKFDNIEDDDKVYIVVDDVHHTKFLWFLTDKFPEITNQKHYFNITYGMYLMLSQYLNTDNFCIRQHVHRIYKHNMNGYCHYKYILDNDMEHGELAEYKKFFHRKYYLEVKQEAVLYTDNPKCLVTLHFKEWTNGVNTFTYVPNEHLYTKIMRNLKIQTFFQ